jgi:NADH-quinone oxidoreductase subunit J
MREYLFQAVFYLSAFLTIIGAIAVVLQKNPVRAVLALVFSFFMVSIIWMMSNAEFLALVLVLVYVGAVMTLFLFVVMMLNIDTDSYTHIPKSYFVVSIIFLLFFLGALWTVMPKDLVLQSVQASTSLGFIIDGVNLSNTEALGSVLYTDYLPLVEITAMLLLVAIVASITLVHRQTREIKRQKIKKQIMVKKSDRLTIVNLSNEI